jgi:hypothetical protein
VPPMRNTGGSNTSVDIVEIAVDRQSLNHYVGNERGRGDPQFHIHVYAQRVTGSLRPAAKEIAPQAQAQQEYRNHRGDGETADPEYESQQPDPNQLVDQGGSARDKDGCKKQSVTQGPNHQGKVSGGVDAEGASYQRFRGDPTTGFEATLK